LGVALARLVVSAFVLNVIVRAGLWATTFRGITWHHAL
jgi:hypothetical protein